MGKWHLDNTDEHGAIQRAALRRGFQSWRAGTRGNLNNGEDYFDWQRFDDGAAQRSSEYCTSAQVDAAAAWWSVPRRGPRLAYVALNAPHTPLHRPPPPLVVVVCCPSCCSCCYSLLA